MTFDSDRSPVFIVGNSRSGTTVLSIALGKHSDIFSFRELHFFEKFWIKDWNKQKEPDRSSIMIMSKLLCGQREGFLYCKNPAIYEDEANNILEPFIAKSNITLKDIYSEFLYSEAVKNDKSIPCEQTPHNVFYIKTIFEYFPDARIIAMVRDPRDVLLSQKKKAGIKFTGKGKVPLKERLRTWSNYHPYIMSKMWNRVSVEIDKWKSDERVMLLRFEDLVSAPENTFSTIAHFIGIDFQNSMLDVPQVGSSNVSDVSDNVGMNKDVLNKWKSGLTDVEVMICQQINKKELVRYDYEAVDIHPGYISTSFQYLMLPVKGGMALIMNIGRSKNILRSIFKRMIK